MTVTVMVMAMELLPEERYMLYGFVTWREVVIRNKAIPFSSIYTYLAFLYSSLYLFLLSYCAVLMERVALL